MTASRNVNVMDFLKASQSSMYANRTPTPQTGEMQALLYHGAFSPTFFGVGGFEPPHGGTKNRCLTAWLHPNSEDNRRAEAFFLQSSFLEASARKSPNPARAPFLLCCLCKKPPKTCRSSTLSSCASFTPKVDPSRSCSFSPLIF